MNVELLREVIAHCVSLDSNDDFAIEKDWRKMTELLSVSTNETIHYFEDLCTDEEFYWLGSVFDDVVSKTQSKELVQVLRNRLGKVVPETYNQQNFKSEHMQKWVDYAEYMRSLTTDIEFAEGRLGFNED